MKVWSSDQKQEGREEHPPFADGSVRFRETHSTWEQGGGTSEGKHATIFMGRSQPLGSLSLLLRRSHLCSAQSSGSMTERVPWLCHQKCIEQTHHIRNFWDRSPTGFPVQYSPEGESQVLSHPFH